MTSDSELMNRRLERAHASLEALVATTLDLDDAAVREPSTLPGWSVGHVLTHVARNADGMVNLARWAITGEPHPMYQSAESRAADIDSGATRPISIIVDDLLASARRFEVAWVEVAELSGDALAKALSRPMHLGSPSPHAPRLVGAQAPLARRREVEIHHTDLGRPYTVADWPADFAVELLDTVVPTRSGDDGLATVVRLVDDRGVAWRLGAGSGSTLQGPAWALGAWLVGRQPGVDVLVAVDAHGLACPVPDAPAWV